MCWYRSEQRLHQYAIKFQFVFWLLHGINTRLTVGSFERDCVHVDQLADPSQHTLLFIYKSNTTEKTVIFTRLARYASEHAIAGLAFLLHEHSKTTLVRTLDNFFAFKYESSPSVSMSLNINHNNQLVDAPYFLYLTPLANKTLHGEHFAYSLSIISNHYNLKIAPNECI